MSINKNSINNKEKKYLLKDLYIGTMAKITSVTPIALLTSMVDYSLVKQYVIAEKKPFARFKIISSKQIVGDQDCSRLNHLVLVNQSPLINRCFQPSVKRDLSNIELTTSQIIYLEQLVNENNKGYFEYEDLFDENSQIATL